MSDDAVESTSSMRELRYAKVLIGGGVGVVGWCCWVVVLGGGVGWFEVCKGAEVCNVRCAKSVNK